MALKAGRAGLRSELVTPDGRLAEGAVQVATATKSKKGIVKIGDGINVNSGTISVPVATASAVGSVKAVTKTDGMTKEVGVDADGKLWVEPSEGGGGFKEGDTITLFEYNDTISGIGPDFENMKLVSVDGGSVSLRSASVVLTGDGFIVFWGAKTTGTSAPYKAFFVTNGTTEGSDIIWSKVVDSGDEHGIVAKVDLSEFAEGTLYLLSAQYSNTSAKWVHGSTSKKGAFRAKHSQTI